MSQAFGLRHSRKHIEELAEFFKSFWFGFELWNPSLNWSQKSLNSETHSHPAEGQLGAPRELQLSSSRAYQLQISRLWVLEVPGIATKSFTMWNSWEKLRPRAPRLPQPSTPCQGGAILIPLWRTPP